MEERKDKKRDISLVLRLATVCGILYFFALTNMYQQAISTRELLWISPRVDLIGRHYFSNPFTKTLKCAWLWADDWLTAVAERLSFAFVSWRPTRSPVLPGVKLRRSLCLKFPDRFILDGEANCEGVGWERAVTAAAAQSEESGRNMVTRVRTLEDRPGKEMKYGAKRKIAGLVMNSTTCISIFEIIYYGFSI